VATIFSMVFFSSLFMGVKFEGGGFSAANFVPFIEVSSIDEVRLERKAIFVR
jgi:hypothetical protein